MANRTEAPNPEGAARLPGAFCHRASGPLYRAGGDRRRSVNALPLAGSGVRAWRVLLCLHGRPRWAPRTRSMAPSVPVPRPRPAARRSVMDRSQQGGRHGESRTAGEVVGLGGPSIRSRHVGLTAEVGDASDQDDGPDRVSGISRPAFRNLSAASGGRTGTCQRV